jgi:hypothetical protein
MKGASILLLAAAAGAGTFAFSRPASALGPVDIEIAARGGYGANPIKNDPINPLGGAIGARAGISVVGIYAGVSTMYYFGGSLPAGTMLSNGLSTTAKESVSSWMYGVAGGYNFNILILTLRPTIEVGNYTIHTSVEGFPSQNTNNIYIEPGVTALLGFGMWFIGADADLFLTPGLQDSKLGFMLNGQVGLKF